MKICRRSVVWYLILFLMDVGQYAPGQWGVLVDDIWHLWKDILYVAFECAPRGGNPHAIYVMSYSSQLTNREELLHLFAGFLSKVTMDYQFHV